MPRLVPTAWMPKCRMLRVITHWTAGGHRASSTDREHYHILVEADGRLVRGEHSIADNVSTGDADYAAHTKGANTSSIGVSICCMLNAVQSPFKPGPNPMTQKQYEVLAIVVADLCERYGIPVTETTVLGHGEVQKKLKIKQRFKWDPMVLPWNPSMSMEAVGDAFRQRVQAILNGGVPVDVVQGESSEHFAPVNITLDGKALTDEGVLKGGASWTPLRLLADKLGWTIVDIDADSAMVDTPDVRKEFVAMIRADRGYAQVKDVAEKMDWPAPTWDAQKRTVGIRTT